MAFKKAGRMAKGLAAVGGKDSPRLGQGIRTGHLIVHKSNRLADDGNDVHANIVN
jgi:hypothetical protein